MTAVPKPWGDAAPVANQAAETLGTAAAPLEDSGPPVRTMQQLQDTMRALAQVAGVRPRLYQNTRTDEEVAAEDMVPEWGNLKRGIRLPHHMLRSLASGPVKRDGGELLEGIGPRVKASGKYSKPGVSTGRTFTSRFRGVHQTFPTRRWEAQFRRAGKPTSLGCFDREEDAARAYDKMMLWIEMHSSGATKAGITNFDVSQYAEDLPWLAGITQDGLIEALRTEGRKQASTRTRPVGAAAARGGDTTPEPDSDWGGDDDDEDEDDEGGGAGRKRRRTAQAKASAAQRRHWQQQQQKQHQQHDLQAQADKQRQQQQEEREEQQVSQDQWPTEAQEMAQAELLVQLIPLAGASGAAATPGALLCDVMQQDGQSAQQLDSTALEALRAAQEAVAAAQEAARQAQEEEERLRLVALEKQQQQGRQHVIQRSSVRAPRPPTPQA